MEIWILIAVAIYVSIRYGLPVLDRAWYSRCVPPDFATTDWRGEWSSEYFRSVSGRILVILPDPIPRDQKFEVAALIYYRIWSPYRTGSAVSIHLDGFLSSDDSGGGGNPDSPVVVPPHLSLNLKGGLAPSKQVINFVAIVDPDCTAIVGGYRSLEPYDMGRFALRKN